MLLLTVLCLVLVAFDTYISYKRIKLYGPFAEVNLLVREVIKDQGLDAGIAVGVVYNIALIAALVLLHLDKVLLFLAGAKFGLCLMQLKSLQMENFVERVLVQARKHKNQS
jgi:hypothetical protein